MSQKPPWLSPRSPAWRRGEPRRVYENAWISVTEEIATAPTGAEALYGVVSFKNRALAVLPLHDDGSVVLVGQPRLPLGDYSWEIPEGGGPLSEDPLAGARRELLEETGLAADQWREILRMQLSNSVTDEVGVGYLALGLREVAAPAGDATEDLAVVRVPFRDALDAALNGHIQDSLTVAMLLRGYHMAHEGLLPDAISRGMIG